MSAVNNVPRTLTALRTSIVTDSKENVSQSALDSVVTTLSVALPIITPSAPANLGSRVMLMLGVVPSQPLVTHVFLHLVVLMLCVSWTMEIQSVPVQEARLATHLSDVSMMDQSVEEINVDPTQVAG